MAASVLRVVDGDAVYVPLVLHALCAGFPSPADDYIEGEIDLNRQLIAIALPLSYSGSRVTA
jgi:hypothetical protein